MGSFGWELILQGLECGVSFTLKLFKMQSPAHFTTPSSFICWKSLKKSFANLSNRFYHFITRFPLYKIFHQIIKMHPVVIVERSVNSFDELLGLPEQTFALGINRMVFVTLVISGLWAITAKLKVIRPRRQTIIWPLKHLSIASCLESLHGKMTLYWFLCSFHLIAAEKQYVSSVHGKKLLVSHLQDGFSCHYEDPHPNCKYFVRQAL